MGAKQSNPLYPSRALRADPSADDTSEDNLSACRPPAVRRRVGGRGHEWFDEELSERRVSYESAVVPELPVDAVERDASASDDLAGNNAVCSTCPSPPQT